MSGKNKLNLLDISLIVVSLVIGMGIFRNPASVAATSGNSSIFFLLWVAGGLIALCGALTYAEIGQRLPAMGGYYKVFAECYHPSVGFSVNAIILISNAASLAVVALIGADYVSDLLYGKPSGIIFNTMVAITAVAMFFVVNLFGLKTSSRTQNVLIIIKVRLMVVLIAALFKGVVIEPHGYEENSPLFTLNNNSAITLFLISLIPVCFAYGGYQQTINFGEEIHSPNKTISKSIFTGILIVIALYLLVNLSYYKVIGFEELKSAKGIAALVAGKLFGPFGKSLFAILLFLAVLAYVDVMLLSNPRVMYAMSKDGMLPAAFSKKYGKREVLTFGLTAFSLISMIVIFYAETFDRILGFVMILDSLGMATSAATLFYFRRKSNADSSSEIYKIKFYPWMPLLFIITYVFVGLACISANPSYGLTSLIVFVTLVLLYFIIKKMGRGEARV